MVACIIPRLLTLILAASLLGTLASCDLQKDIDLDLPVMPPQLVVECYLENGQIPRLTVTETTAYLADPTPAVPTDVSVTLTLPNGQQQALRFLPGVNPATRKLYTHTGTRPLAARPGDTFTLVVTDTQGRRVTGTATMPTAIPLDTVKWTFNNLPPEQREALITASFQDPGATTDFYRFQIHRDSVSSEVEIDYNVDDRLNNGRSYTLGTGYRFELNDTLLVTLFHLDEPYYRFLESVDAARGANGNPFAQPASIRSTVQGGIGVFTILNYDRRTIIVQ